MSNINGDWFHSRSISNLSELIAVGKIMKESEKSKYQSLKWPAGREAHSELFDLAKVADVKLSTMQTKVRAMVRFGFVQDKSICLIQTGFYCIIGFPCVNKLIKLIKSDKTINNSFIVNYNNI